MKTLTTSKMKLGLIGLALCTLAACLSQPQTRDEDISELLEENPSSIRTNRDIDVADSFPHYAQHQSEAFKELVTWVQTVEAEVAQEDLPFVPDRVVFAVVEGAVPDHVLPDTVELKRLYPNAFEESRLSRVYQATLPEGLSVASVLEEFVGDPRIEWIEPLYNQLELFEAEVNDPLTNSAGSWGQNYGDQWGFDQINTAQAWELTDGDETQVIAVIDTGVDFGHEDLAGRAWANPNEIADNGIDDDGNGYIDDINGWDFRGGTNNPGDTHGHGTFCAGIIAANANNGLGIAGINQRSSIMALRVMSPDQSSDLDYAMAMTRYLADAIVYAADNNVKVVNNSWGLPFPSKLVTDAIDYAHQKGTVMVFASGNSAADSHFFYPQAHWSVLTVNASTPADEIAVFSNYGVASDVIAPGGGGLGDSESDDPRDGVRGVVSTLAAGSYMETSFPQLVLEEYPRYQRQAGTSFAAPHAVGVISLMQALHPDATVEQIRTMLRQSSDDVSFPGFDLQTGYGRVNARSAVQATPNLAARITSPATGTTKSVHDSLTVRGLANGTDVSTYRLSYGIGQLPRSWNTIAEGQSTSSEQQTFIEEWSLENQTPGEITLRLELIGMDGSSTEHRILIRIETPQLDTWPIDLADEFSGSSIPVIADINGDGEMELVFATQAMPWTHPQDYSGGYLHARNANNEEIQGFPAQFRGSPHSELAIGDILTERDGLETVVVVSDTNEPGLHLIGADGQEIRDGSWPIIGQVNQNMLLGLSLGNLDEDEGLEIVTNRFGVLLKAFDNDGSMMWEGDLDDRAVLAVADVDGDGQQEVIDGTFSRKIRIRNGDGTMKFEWSIGEFYDCCGTNGGRAYKMTVANLDDDEDLEIALTALVALDKFEVRVFDYTGEMLPGWPVEVEYTTALTVHALSLMVADVNGDMQNEIVVAARDLSIFSADGTLLSAFALNARSFPRQMAAGDITGDGIAEILLSLDMEQGGSMSRESWVFDGRTNTVVPGWPSPDVGPALVGLIWGDLNGDNLAEVVDFGVAIEYEPLSPHTRVRVFDTQGAGISASPMARVNARRTNSISLIVGDANHSGSVDWYDIDYLDNYLHNDGTLPAQFLEVDVTKDGLVDVDDLLALWDMAPFKRGDANGDGALDISDGQFVADYLFNGGEAPVPMEAGDANGDGKLDLSDSIYIFDYLFQGGPQPPAPF